MKKSENGITIISLIITIIIIVILAVISIQVINENKILDKSEIAKETYSEAEEKEKIKLAVAQATIDSGSNAINKESFKIALTEQFKDDFEFTNETTDYFKVKIKSSKRIYKIDRSRNIEKINGWIDNGDNSVTKGDTTLNIGDILTKDEIKKIIEDSKEDIIENGGIKYEGSWQIIGIENDKLKLVSTDNVANQILGYEEEIFNEKDENGNPKINIVDTTGDGDTTFEKSAYSYAYAEETLNKKALTATGIKTARSITLDDIYSIIGSDSLPKSSVGYGYGDKYKYYTNIKGTIYYQTWDEETESWSDEKWATQQFTYVDDKKQIKTFGTLDDKKTKVKSVEDVIYTYDWFNSYFNSEQIDKLKNIIAKKDEPYWLATKSVGGGGPGYKTFSIRCIQDEKLIRSFSLFGSNKTKGTAEKGVRAIIFI